MLAAQGDFFISKGVEIDSFMPVIYDIKIS
nr:MAG TPA: hypothetical protein [Caudoviricetes sp.]